MSFSAVVRFFSQSLHFPLPPQRRVSRQRSRQSIDSQNSETVYLDSNLEITSANFFNDSDEDESIDDFQVNRSIFEVRFSPASAMSSSAWCRPLPTIANFGQELAKALRWQKSN